MNDTTTKRHAPVIGWSAAIALLLIAAPVAHADSGIKLAISPTASPDVPKGGRMTLTLTDKNHACPDNQYSYSIDPPPVGSALVSGNQLVYMNDGTHGYLTTDKKASKFKVYIRCNSTGKRDDKKLKPYDSTAGGGGGGTGGGGGGTGGGGSGSGGAGSGGSGGSLPPPSPSAGKVIFDNTSNPNTAAIGANLIFIAGGSKGATAIKTGYGGNAINILDFQTLVRDAGVTPHDLLLYIGNDPKVVNDQKLGKKGAFDFFANGRHLFDLERLRSTADWLSQDSNGNGIPDHIAPDPGVPYGTYGTLSMRQFIDNIVNDRTMYGIVRVKVPLELQSSAGGTARNALNQVVNANQIYGFCSNASAGLCSCAPGKSGFGSIKPGASVCGMGIPPSAKIKVRGALLWDFVDNMTGRAIPLANLPFVPRALYFKVEIPILVNAEGDLDNDGAMDNMPYIKSLTASMSGTNPINITNTIATIDYNRVPQVAKDAYLHATGTPLTAAEFARLNRPTQYHLLMPSGYETGWADAFDRLNITARTWASLPPAGCISQSGGACSKFSVPPGIGGILTANDIRSDAFEDIPTYLYSGGLIDMHHHVNISGLVYVPQGMELEAKDSTAPTQQYIYGAVVVRDTFYIEAKTNTITVFSAGPETYSTALTTLSSASTSRGPALSTLGYGGTAHSGGGSGGTPAGSAAPSTGTVCIGCSGSGASSSGSGGTPGAVRWVEIHPR